MFCQYSCIPKLVDRLIPIIRTVNLSTRPNVLIETLNGKNGNFSVEKRLQDIYGILSNKSTSLQSQAIECLSIYNSTDLSFLSELLDHQYLHQKLFRLFKLKYRISSSIRIILYKDLQNLFLNNRYSQIKSLLNHISSIKMVLGFHNNSSIDISREKLANELILLIAKSGDPLIASLYLIDLHNKGVTIQQETISAVFRCLIVPNTKQQLFHNYAILKLINKFNTFSFSAKELSSIILFVCINTKTCYIPNLIFEKLYPKILEHKDNEELSTALIQFILLNIRNFQYHKATEIFKQLIDFEKVKNSGQIQVELLSSLPSKFAKDLIPLFNFDMADKKVLHFILKHHANDKDKIQEIISNLEPPVDRGTLSILFDVFVSNGEDSEAKEILLHILESETGLNDQDFNSIISKLLENDEIDKSVRMVRSKNITISKLAYITIFKYLSNRDLLDKYQDFLKEMAIELGRIKNDSTITSLLPIVIEYLTNKIHLLVARRFIVTILNSMLNNAKDRTKLLRLHQYSLPNEFSDIMVTTNGNLIQCIYIILNAAIKEGDLDSIRWSIQELRNNGILLKDILSHIKLESNSFFDTVFIADILKKI